ncbi:MAG: hypothetical protein WBK20_14810 [Spirochaetota bacterium]
MPEEFGRYKNKSYKHHTFGGNGPGSGGVTNHFTVKPSQDLLFTPMIVIVWVKNNPIIFYLKGEQELQAPAPVPLLYLCLICKKECI